jgi:hypothetical protein
VHPSDEEAWKEFNRVHLSFASDPKNIWLGLCTDGFCSFDMLQIHTLVGQSL